MTIKKQRRLNWVLAVLSSLLAICALLAVIFARYRNRISKELAIKTKEAASADKLKTDFLGMISHELRTPLNGIIGISDLLAHHYPDPDVRHKTSIVLDSGNQLLNVVSSITDMATVEAGKMEVYPHGSDIPSLLAETIAECQDKADKKSLAFTQFIDPELHIHATDGQRLQQCVFNLLDNAIKFTDEGRVHLHVTAQKDETGHITGLRAIVADTGQGMSELVQSRLFTPFMQADSSMTRKFGGAGLNLAVTRALARLMDGDLTMVSREGRGSEFTLDLDFATSITLDAADPISTSVTQVAEAPSILDMQMSDIIDDTPLTTDGAVIDLMLPTASDTPALHSATVEVEPTTPSTKISDLTGLRILLVDDIESNRDIVRMMLEAEGCICFDAANGEDAITALHAGPIDIVMMDIRMPVMDGVEATRAIRQSDTPFARVPIIALTADSEAQTNAACMAAGADIFLTKPIMAHELTRALRFLRASGQSRLLSAV